MVYIADTITAGKKMLVKMSFAKLPHITVWQFGECSIDVGKTWTKSFDFTYSRKK
jgi:ribosomal protein L30E